MREKSVNEKAVLNTLNFLRELNQRCDEGKLTAVTWLTDKYDIDHTTGTACKELNIITIENGIYKWVPKAEPGRVMALNVMDRLLERRKAKVDPPSVFPDISAQLEKFTDKIVEASRLMVANKAPETRMLKRAMQQAPMMGNTLFAEVESKAATRVNVLECAITALYSGRNLQDLDDKFIQEANATAFRIADDVINKMYANQ